MRKFTSVEELFADIEKNKSLWDKFITHPSMDWLRWTIYNLPDVPRDLYRKCRRGLQRAYRGVADEDVWGFDWYLSKVILRGLKRLKETKRGCPFVEGFNGESDFEEMEKEWNRILDTMIWTFEVTQKIQDDRWLLSPLQGWTEEEQKRLTAFYLMTAEETRKYYVGWSNFQKYYFGLWD